MITDISRMLGTKKPCQTPGCDYPNWHVCTVGKPDLFPELLAAETGKTPRQIRRMRTPEHCEAISQANRERWARERQRNAARDRAIVAMYNENIYSIRTVGQRFGIGVNACRRILETAQANGETTIRAQGKTLKYGFN